MNLPVAWIPGYDDTGTPVLSVIAKATYSIAHNELPCLIQCEKIISTDIFDKPHDPANAEILYESELAAFKPYTDVIVHGFACAPHKESALYLDCSIAIGSYTKNVRVFGLRQLIKNKLLGSTFSKPIPFERAPFSYRNAYGGIAFSKEGHELRHPLNPIGTGFSAKNSKFSSTITVPSQEDPSSPITPDSLVMDDPSSWLKAPIPASFGFTRRDSRHRLPLSHKDTDTMPWPACHPSQSASPGLYGIRLLGNESVTAIHMDALNPTFTFPLPTKVPIVSLDSGDGPKELTTYLDTCIIDKEANRLTMLWRGSMVYDGLHTLENLQTILPLAFFA
jgi:hypothetical protein